MSHLSRRRFLEDSMLAATAALAAGPISQVLAEEKKTSANEKLSVGIIGAGGRGGSHVAGFGSRADCEITYICDCDEKNGRRRVEEIGKKHGREPKFVKDMREMFDDKSLDVVSTATPNHWHSLCSIWAIQAGKDMYVEKPVSHNVSEGRRVVEAARKYNKICQTGTQCRSMPATIEAIEFVKAGKIGTVKIARGLCYKPRNSIGPRGNYEVPSTVDYNLWAGPAPMSPLTRKNFHYDWHWQWDCGNGDLGNQGIHQMDVARWGLGVDMLSRNVFSYGGRFGYEDAGDTANTQVVVHDYGDKQLVFEVRGLKTDALREAKVGVIFEGTDGYVVMTSYNKGAAFAKDGKTMIKEFTDEKKSGDQVHFDNFLTAVRSRNPKDLNADILEGHLSSALCHLGNISYRLGKPTKISDARSQIASSGELAETFNRYCEHLTANKVPLDSTEMLLGQNMAFDPQTEKFVNDSAADRMLTREYRAPFIVPAAGQV